MRSNPSVLIRADFSGPVQEAAQILAAPPISHVHSVDPTASKNMIQAGDGRLTTGWAGQRCALLATEFNESVFLAISLRFPQSAWRITWRTQAFSASLSGLILRAGQKLFAFESEDHKDHCLAWLMNSSYDFYSHIDLEEHLYPEDVEPNFPRRFNEALEFLR